VQFSVHPQKKARKGKVEVKSKVTPSKEIEMQAPRNN
jgi:hypothetical protein